LKYGQAITGIFLVGLTFGLNHVAIAQGNNGPQGITGLGLAPLTLAPLPLPVHQPAVLSFAGSAPVTGGAVGGTISASGQTGQASSAAMILGASSTNFTGSSVMPVISSIGSDGGAPAATMAVLSLASLGHSVNSLGILSLPILGYGGGEGPGNGESLSGLPTSVIALQGATPYAPPPAAVAPSSGFSPALGAQLGLDALSLFGGLGNIGNIGNIGNLGSVLPPIPGVQFPR
jgi:hypothetical protein